MTVATLPTLNMESQRSVSHHALDSTASQLDQKLDMVILFAAANSTSRMPVETRVMRRSSVKM